MANPKGYTMDSPNSNTPESKPDDKQETSTLENLKNAKDQLEQTVDQLQQVGSQLGKGFEAIGSLLRKAGGR